MKAMVGSILMYGSIVAVCLSVLAICSVVLYRFVLQAGVRAATQITAESGIDSLERIRLGGLQQWILIRGTSISNPVLLILHGGPGAADIMFARHFDGDLVNDFVVVHWDQRGAGKSYSAFMPVDSMNRDQFVSDTCELTNMLRERFDTDKIYLLGHSWGSEIGMLAASRCPESLKAYIGVGQVVEKEEQEQISYRYAVNKAEESGNKRAADELAAIGPPPWPGVEQQSVQRKWLERFGGVYHGEPITFGDYIRIGLASPDYTLRDGWRFLRGRQFSETSMWKERLGTDLFHEVRRVDVPVYFLAGRHDFNTPSELVERYYEMLDAPRGKELVWFERAGHMIPYESPNEFRAVLSRIKGDSWSK